MEETTTKLSINDIKKILYKDNPVANLQYVRKGHVYYKALIRFTTGDSPIKESKYINFDVPIVDMGDADFHAEMSGKHLIRWIIKEEDNN